MPKYKHLAVKKIALADIVPQKPTSKTETPRQRATRERDEEIVAIFNEAAALHTSEAIAIELRGDQKLATMRAAINRLLIAEGRDLSYGVRGTTIYISKGNIPGGRGRKRTSHPRSRSVEAPPSSPKD